MINLTICCFIYSDRPHLLILVETDCLCSETISVKVTAEIFVLLSVLALLVTVLWLCVCLCACSSH